MKPSLPSVHSRIDQVASCRFWHPPPQNFLKCNVDTAFFNHARMCWLLKREKLSASWMRCAGFDLWGYRRVIFEVDAKSILNSMAMERTDLSELHSIVSLCGGLLNMEDGFSLKFFRSQANGLAHKLARASSKYLTSHS